MKIYNGPMTSRLPVDVEEFLLENPDQVEKIRSLMHAIKENAKFAAMIAERRKNAPTVPCGTYGCTIPRNEMDVMCKSCYQDYLDDPDAYK